jgi:hypothetical protein
MKTFTSWESNLLRDSTAISVVLLPPAQPGGGGGQTTDKCMSWNTSTSRYSDDVKVCIGFYIDDCSGFPYFQLDDW